MTSDAARFAHLPSRGLLAVNGDDAAAFLQRLVTGNVRNIAVRRVVYAALLTPQGRYLHDFLIFPWQDGYVLDAEATRLNDLRVRLLRYALHAKVTIEALPPTMQAFAAFGRVAIEAPEACGASPDPRLPALGWRFVGNESVVRAALEQSGAMETTAEAYDDHRLRLGIPDGSRDFIVEKSLLLDFGIDDLHGVDFDKGCYVGQEVTTRSRWRDTIRRFLCQVEVRSGSLPMSGTTLQWKGQPSGEMRSSTNGVGLAILHPADVRDGLVQGGHFMAGAGEALAARFPAWATLPQRQCQLTQS